MNFFLFQIVHSGVGLLDIFLATARITKQDSAGITYLFPFLDGPAV